MDESRGVKRNYEFESSKSDKEQAPMKNTRNMKNSLHMVIMDPSVGGWKNMKKKKGRKGKIEDYYNP